MTSAIMKIYQTNQVTGGVASDLMKAAEHEDFDAYILNGGQLASVESFYRARGLMAEVVA